VGGGQSFEEDRGVGWWRQGGDFVGELLLNCGIGASTT
jgi:hypothetical protein